MNSFEYLLGGTVDCTVQRGRTVIEAVPADIPVKCTRMGHKEEKSGNCRIGTSGEACLQGGGGLGLALESSEGQGRSGLGRGFCHQEEPCRDSGHVGMLTGGRRCQ